jgi:Methyltransferase domain
MDPRKDIVRRGCDALSYLYRGDAEEPELYATWLAQLHERVPAGGSVLDLGCGCGVPLARDLAASGYAVTGVDLSAGKSGAPASSFPRQGSSTPTTQISFPPPPSMPSSACTQEVIPEGDGVHALFWARRPLDRPH